MKVMGRVFPSIIERKPGYLFKQTRNQIVKVRNGAKNGDVSD